MLTNRVFKQSNTLNKNDVEEIEVDFVGVIE